ncbi:DUF309 domain-containing protein [Streptomyces durbertensis]|uniref:DUF309 domain-containing protein n=1 Tax=Streptomyces durbertensis TaxID=2448886 RepID=A0ABR6EPG6_9ACTN|nr:DUF309 domain-containing protein [Streptomyces durbertensis]
MPYGSPGVERQPEGVPRTPAQALAEAQRLLDDGMPFHAHEVLEDAWKSRPADEEPLWRGLAQLAVGVTHAARGNASGARGLLRRGAANLERGAPDTRHGVDVDGLLRWAERLAADPELASGPPRASDPAPRLTARGT